MQQYIKYRSGKALKRTMFCYPWRDKDDTWFFQTWGDKSTPIVRTTKNACFCFLLKHIPFMWNAVSRFFLLNFYKTIQNGSNQFSVRIQWFLVLPWFFSWWSAGNEISALSVWKAWCSFLVAFPAVSSPLTGGPDGFAYLLVRWQVGLIISVWRCLWMM